MHDRHGARKASQTIAATPKEYARLQRQQLMQQLMKMIYTGRKDGSGIPADSRLAPTHDSSFPCAGYYLIIGAVVFVLMFFIYSVLAAAELGQLVALIFILPTSGKINQAAKGFPEQRN